MSSGAMNKHNYVMSPINPYIRCSWNEGCFCGDNGQCCKFECQEWSDDATGKSIACMPELIRNERGYVSCPKCFASYGEYALTGAEYKEERKKLDAQTTQ